MNPAELMKSNDQDNDLTDIFGVDGLVVDNHDEFQAGRLVMDEGTYPFEISKAELKKTKDFATNGGGKYLSFSFKRTEGGGMVFQNCNVVNKSKDTAERAKAEVAAIARASGLSSIPTNPDAFVGSLLGIQVGKRVTRDSKKAIAVNPMSKPEYENYIERYVPASHVSQGKTAAANPQQPAQAETEPADSELETKTNNLVGSPPTTNLPNFK